MKDIRSLTHPAAWMLAGFLLWCSLTSCGLLTPAEQKEARQGAGQVLKDSAPFLPSPFNWIAQLLGVGIAAYGGHKVTRHVMHRQRAKAPEIGMPSPPRPPPSPQA
jgi:hypothetical protein